MPNRVLVVEDDRSLAEVLEYNLAQAGYQVSVARDGLDGLRQARQQVPALVILDVMLPMLNGLEVCRQLRAGPETRDVAILMLTAKAEEVDQVVGFNVGTDDYVAKPFSVKILLERVKALLRRTDNSDGQSEVTASQGITVDRIRHRAVAGDRVLELTPSEFKILEALVRHPGRAFTRNELISSALGENTMVLDRTIDVHVRALRQKLGAHAKLVETVRGVGYRFRDPRQR